MNDRAHLLLIDDDEDDRECLLSIVEAIAPAARCHIASNGFEGLNYLNTADQHADLVILDLNMPVMDGRQFLSELQRHSHLRTIPVVILSTSSDKHEVAEAKALGARLFITKPDKYSRWEEAISPVIKDFIETKMTTLSNDNIPYFISMNGELPALVRKYDWGKTSIGPLEKWNASLRCAVSTVLNSGFPMLLWWGEELIQFYNDAFRPILGVDGKHPGALGKKAKDCWPEAWHVMESLIEGVRKTGESFFHEDFLVPVRRNGRIEDVYWTFSFSAVLNDSGSIGGVLAVCKETTRRVHSHRELVRARKQLAQSEASLRSIILDAPVAMCILSGSDFVVEIANSRMLQLWGKSKEAVYGKPITEALAEAQSQGYEELLKNVYTTGKSVSVDSFPISLLRNGSLETVYINFVYEAMRDQAGVITGVIAVAVDVTAQVMATSRIAQSEEMFRNLVEQSVIATAVLEGRDMKLKLVNDAMLGLWGRDRGIVGMPLLDYMPELKTQEFPKILEDVFATGGFYSASDALVTIVRDGSRDDLYMDFSYKALKNRDGEVYAILVAAIDVTHRILARKELQESRRKLQESEDNLTRIIREAPVAMCILAGSSFVIEVANEEIIELWGKPREEVMNKPVFDALPDARGQGLEEVLATVYRTGETYRALERPVELLRNGKYETVYQNFVYEPHRDSNGNTIGVIAVTIDVTQEVTARLKIEDIVKERTESLQKSNAQLSQFAYIASHDLQEPVRKISTFVEMLQQTLGDSIDSRAKAYLGKIDSASARMLRLIRDVLTLSQLSRKEQEFHRVDLNQVVE